MNGFLMTYFTNHLGENVLCNFTSKQTYYLVISSFDISLFTAALMKKEREIHDLKTKIAEVMAVMPHSNYSGSTSPISGTPRYSGNFVSSEEPPVILPVSPHAHGGGGGGDASRGVQVTQSVTTGASASSTPVSIPQGSSSSQSPSPSVSPVPSIGNGKSVLDPNAAVYRPKSN